jgi:hypothetical protein
MMPAYRSSAEGEIRSAVIAKLRLFRPSIRIINEINIDNGTCRADVLGVMPNEIYAVEIKSERDTLSRLPDQLGAMARVAHCVIAAVHESHIPALKYRSNVHWWLHPEANRPVSETNWYPASNGWQAPSLAVNSPLPQGAITVLWRAELKALCDRYRVSYGPRSNMRDMIAALHWHCTGQELTKGICAMLRMRDCVEADPPIDDQRQDMNGTAEKRNG